MTRSERDADEFYDLLVEWTFGDGNNHDRECALVEELDTPEEWSREDENRFALTLVTRLLFVRHMEQEGVVDDEALRELAGGTTTLDDVSRLFDAVFSRTETRLSSTKTRVVAKSPLSQAVPDEEEVAVNGEVLSDLVDDLLLNERESGGFAHIGRVLERVINYIGGELGNQKAVGAYYTPEDITEELLDDTVRRRICHLFAEEWSNRLNLQQGEAVAAFESVGLDELLNALGSESTLTVGEREVPMDLDEGVRAVHERLPQLTILDPACGSGHFLVAAFEEVVDVREQLGEQLGECSRDEEMVEFASRGVCGVDVEPVAVEIARLRLVEAMHERLDVTAEKVRPPERVLRGNALVGKPKPAADEGQNTISSFTTRNRGYAKSMEHTFSESVDDPREIGPTLQSVPGTTLHPEVESVQVRRRDGGELSGKTSERLDSLGFAVYTKSARLDVKSRHRELCASGASSRVAREQISTAIERAIDGDLTASEVVRQPVERDAEDAVGGRFDWEEHFSDVLRRGGFDVVVGNPPYGDLLSGGEAGVVRSYRTGGKGEIALPFVERQIGLLREGGTFGNVTTTAVVNRTDVGDFHELLREELREITITSIARRPSKPFPNAEVNVATLTGVKDSVSDGGLRTSDFVRFGSGERREKLRRPPTTDVSGLVLGDDFADRGDDFEIVPKVGGEQKRDILRTLADQDETIGDWLGETSDLHYRRAANYWMNVARETPPSGATNMNALGLDGELKRDFAFIALNSSLFYAYWITYGNLHDVTRGRVTRFPVPAVETIESHDDEIRRTADQLERVVEENYHPDEYHQFRMANVKPSIDRAESLVGRCYGLTRDEVEFLTDYHAEYGRSSKPD